MLQATATAAAAKAASASQHSQVCVLSKCHELYSHWDLTNSYVAGNRNSSSRSSGIGESTHVMVE